MQDIKLTLEGDEEGSALELDGEELAVGVLLGNVLGLLDWANGDCSITVHKNVTHELMSQKKMDAADYKETNAVTHSFQRTNANSLLMGMLMATCLTLKVKK